MRSSNSSATPDEGRRRAVIAKITPSIDGGRFPVKRIVGDFVTVEATIFADGHESIAAVLRFRHENAAQWTELGMQIADADQWRASFRVERLGRYFYTVEAWIDPVKTWCAALRQERRERPETTANWRASQRVLHELARGAPPAVAAEIGALADAIADGMEESSLSRQLIG